MMKNISGKPSLPSTKPPGFFSGARGSAKDPPSTPPPAPAGSPAKRNFSSTDLNKSADKGDVTKKNRVSKKPEDTLSKPNAPDVTTQHQDPQALPTKIRSDKQAIEFLVMQGYTPGDTEFDVLNIVDALISITEEIPAEMAQQRIALVAVTHLARSIMAQRIASPIIRTAEKRVDFAIRMAFTKVDDMLAETVEKVDAKVDEMMKKLDENAQELGKKAAQVEKPLYSKVASNVDVVSGLANVIGAKVAICEQLKRKKVLINLGNANLEAVANAELLTRINASVKKVEVAVGIDTFKVLAITRPPYRPGHILLDVDTVEGADQFKNEVVRTAIMAAIGVSENTQIVPKMHKALVRYVPTSYGNTKKDLEGICEVNGLDKNDVVDFTWIKSPERRRKNQ
ncbi:hypothetical protein BDN72DRAFT_895521, partial [Pluteus cervinus]